MQLPPPADLKAGTAVASEGRSTAAALGWAAHAASSTAGTSSCQGMKGSADHLPESFSPRVPHFLSQGDLPLQWPLASAEEVDKLPESSLVAWPCSPPEQPPKLLAEVLAEVSHQVVWLHCSPTLPLPAFSRSCCAKRASGWPLPSLAALHRAGPDPPAALSSVPGGVGAVHSSSVPSALTGPPQASAHSQAGNLAAPLLPGALQHSTESAAAPHCKGAPKPLADLEWAAAKQPKTLTRGTERGRKAATEGSCSEPFPGTWFLSAWRHPRLCPKVLPLSGNH